MTAANILLVQLTRLRSNLSENGSWGKFLERVMSTFDFAVGFLDEQLRDMVSYRWFARQRWCGRWIDNQEANQLAWNKFWYLEWTRPNEISLHILGTIWSLKFDVQEGHMSSLDVLQRSIKLYRKGLLLQESSTPSVTQPTCDIVPCKHYFHSKESAPISLDVFVRWCYLCQ